MNVSPEAGCHLHVLLLEDSPSDVRTIRDVLTEAGFDLEMDLATERGRFVQLLTGEVYDVILADYRLPGLNARSARELACAASPGTPFVGLAAMVSEEIAAQLMEGCGVHSALEERMTRLPVAVRRALSLDARACRGMPTAGATEPSA